VRALPPTVRRSKIAACQSCTEDCKQVEIEVHASPDADGEAVAATAIGFEDLSRVLIIRDGKVIHVASPRELEWKWRILELPPIRNGVSPEELKELEGGPAGSAPSRSARSPSACRKDCVGFPLAG